MIRYSIIIRTLGNGGEKYKKLLESINSLTVQPYEVLIVIPNGVKYDFPEINNQKIIYSERGMVLQRAKGIQHSKAEFLLLLDDDIEFGSDFVEHLLKSMLLDGAEIIVPAIRNLNGDFVMLYNSSDHYQKLNFYNYLVTYLQGIRIYCSKLKNKDLLISKSGGYVVNTHTHTSTIFEIQVGSGAAIFGLRESLSRCEFEDELWLDQSGYAILEDQVLLYKAYKMGNKIILDKSIECTHLDGKVGSMEVSKSILYHLERNNIIFWHRFIFSVAKGRLASAFCVISLFRRLFFNVGIHLLKLDFIVAYKLLNSYTIGFMVLHSKKYKSLQKISK